MACGTRGRSSVTFVVQRRSQNPSAYADMWSMVATKPLHFRPGAGTDTTRGTRTRSWNCASCCRTQRCDSIVIGASRLGHPPNDQTTASCCARLLGPVQPLRIRRVATELRIENTPEERCIQEYRGTPGFGRVWYVSRAAQSLEAGAEVPATERPGAGTPNDVSKRPCVVGVPSFRSGELAQRTKLAEPPEDS